MPHYTLFFFKEALSHITTFSVFRAWALMTEVALELTERGGEGHVRIHATHFCYFIPDPNPLPVFG